MEGQWWNWKGSMESFYSKQLISKFVNILCIVLPIVLQVSTEGGMIHSIDRTQSHNNLFTLNAHDSSLSGMLHTITCL